MTSTYHSVNSLVRGLNILKTLSEIGDGSTATISAQTGIPRPSVHRLLETLREAGYVQRSQMRETFRLTSAIRTLAEGYIADDWISEIAEPLLAKLRAEVVWPTDIATYMHGSMVVRATTHSNNPLAIERVASGRQLRMLGTSTGLCYLAFCEESERRAILETIDALGIPTEDRMPPSMLDRELKQTRERGYGIRIRGRVQSKTSSIAVPVMHETKVLACINIVWIHSAIALQTAVERYLKPLQKAASKMEAEYLKYIRKSRAAPKEISASTKARRRSATRRSASLAHGAA